MSLYKRRIGGLDVLESTIDPQKKTCILLHGFGSNAEDLASLRHIYPINWIFPQGPLAIPFASGYVGKAWFDVDINLLLQKMREKKYDEISHAFPTALDFPSQIINDLIDDLNLPRSHLILGGFSQGAILALDAAFRRTEPLAALLIFSGALLYPFQWDQKIAQHKLTRFFQSHGTMDHLLPLERAEALSLLLKKEGLKGEFYAFEGGHEIPYSVQTKLKSFLKIL